MLNFLPNKMTQAQPLSTEDEEHVLNWTIFRAYSWKQIWWLQVVQPLGYTFVYIHWIFSGIGQYVTTSKRTKPGDTDALSITPKGLWMSHLYSKCTTMYEYINLKLFNEFILYYNTIKEK